jgi:peptidoglycan/LPS O-acetylase OafA/YrhL
LNVCLVWAALILFGALAFIAATPFFASADDLDSADQTARLKSLDGLRGYLALAVAMHHGVITYGYVTTGKWTAPPSAFFNQLGQASVGLFFIITAYLFWGKVLRSEGAIDFPRLLIGRTFRIGPVFLVIVITLMSFALISSGFVAQVPGDVLAGQFLQNLALGILPVSSFNGVSIGHQLASVTWTLVYEWEFYFFLPVLAALAWRRDLTLPIIVGLVALASFLSAITQGQGLTLITFFLIGVLCATFESRGFKPEIPSWLSSMIAIALLAATYGFFPGSLYGPLPALLLGASFFLILCGADLFGLLRLKGSRRLGAVSYDLYLCHGAVLATAFAISPVRETALLSPIAYWLVLSAILLVAISVALVLHVTVERPGIALGRNFIAWMHSPAPLRDERRTSEEKATPEALPAE